MNFFSELNRRNVVRVGVAYLVVGWVLTQVAGSLEAALTLPDWFDTVVVAFLGLGLPVALFLSWAYEMTAEGVIRTEDVDADASITHNTGHKLNYLIIGGLVIAVAFLLYDRSASPERGASSQTAIIDKSIAVLPFVDLSPEGDQEYFSDGLTEEILNSLARLPELKVTARTSAFFFKGRNIPIPEIAATLGVAHIVEGSVRRAGDKLRITAQLVRAEDGFHLWSQTYDRSVEDIFAVQEDVAENIARAMDIILDDERRAEMFTFGTRNVESYEAFLKGVALSDEIHDLRSTRSLWESYDLFTRAIEADPNFANAYYFRVDSYAHFLFRGASDVYLSDQHPEGMTSEKALALLHQDMDKAIELTLNPSDRAVYELEKITFSDDWRAFPAAVEKLRISNTTRSNSFEGGWALSTLALIGEGELAYEISMAGVDRSPLDGSLWAEAAAALLVLGRLEEGSALIERAHSLGVTHSWLTDLEIAISIAANDLERLQAMFDRLLPAQEHLRAAMLGALGREDEASALLADVATADSPEEGRVWAYALVGEQAKADALAREVDSRLLGAYRLGTNFNRYGGNHFPVSFENMPNLARLLREAGLSEAQLAAMEPENSH